MPTLDPRIRCLAAAVLVLATAAGCADGSADARTPQPRSSTSATAAEPSGAVRTVQARPAPRVGSVRPERPVVSTLPNGTVVPVQAVGVRSDGSLAVPEDIKVAGWWQGGSRLGDPFGSTLLAAHVDSFTQGLGPYSSLLSARRGQRVEVASRHLQQTFRIVSLQLVAKGTLAQHPVFFSARGARRLTLVTCAGPYVPSKGGYQNLAVITAVPISDPVTRSMR